MLRSGDRAGTAGLLRNGEGPVVGGVPLRVDEIVELLDRERVPLVAQFVHLDPVQQDKKVIGGGHLRRCLYDRFSVHQP